MADWSFLDSGQPDDGTIRINTSRPSRRVSRSSESWDAVRTVLSWVVAAALIGGCVHLVNNLPQQTDAQFAEDDNRSLALINAQHRIKQMLRSPRSAKWPSVFADGIDTRTHAVKQQDGTYVVRSWVDADNAFGASIRTWYVVHLRPRKDGNADIFSAELLE